MARKASKTQQDQAETQPEVNPENTEQDESTIQEPEVSDKEEQAPERKVSPRTKVRMVEATLKTRHCSGGICKEAGETMRMTEGEYDRLKKYGRVE